MHKQYLILLFMIFIFAERIEASDHRGIWVVRQAFASADEVDRFIHFAHKMQITDIYVQVRALGESFYNSETAPDLLPSQSKPDILGLLVKRAHENNMRLHAWLNVLYIWSGNGAPPRPPHLFVTSKKSILRSATDKTIPDYKTLRSKGIEGYFIDPFDEMNYLFLRNSIDELIKRYQVDGIHLDYFRYPGIEYSFSLQNRAKFFLQNYIDPEAIYRDTALFSAERGIEAFQFIDQVYRNFLNEELTNLLANLRQYIKELNKNVQISLAVKPSLSDARHIYFQDWSNWLDAELCDRVLLMNYQTDINLFKANVTEALELKKNDRIIIGVSLYNQEEAAVLKRLEYIESLPLAGYALFSYNYLRENTKMFQRMIYWVK